MIGPQLPTTEEVIDAVRPYALQLVGVVRDRGPADVEAVVGAIPHGEDGRNAALVLLAAMVDPGKTPGQLLAWTDMLLPSGDQAEWLRLRSLGVSDDVAAVLAPVTTESRRRARKRQVGRESVARRRAAAREAAADGCTTQEAAS